MSSAPNERSIMSTPKETVAASNEAALDLVKAVQEQILDATRSYVSAISDASPEKLGWTAPEPPEHADPKDLIEQTFKFQSQLLEANKAFALSLTETWGTLEHGPKDKATK
jgi:hypothetical protein